MVCCVLVSCFNANILLRGENDTCYFGWWFGKSLVATFTRKVPKQFLKLTGSLTMLQSTLSRLNNLNADDSIVICNEEHRFIVAEQLRELGKLSNNIILEPKGRNTAPAITLAALAAKENSLMKIH